MPLYNLPFRIGTTSYIIPDDILPNARYLAGRVQDIQLVLFELDDDQNNLPDKKVTDELKILSITSDLTYTVHLPLDLRLAANNSEMPVSLEKARRVIESTLCLEPRAYIVHLDGREERNSNDESLLSQWKYQAVESLKIVAGYCGNMKLLAVENLENYPPDFNDRVIQEAGSSRCVDIGHLWLNGHDPVNFLDERIDETPVIHLHGIGERDHQSLQLMPEENVDRLFRYLLNHDYRGVLTLEVFSESDLVSSLQTIEASLSRI